LPVGLLDRLKNLIVDADLRVAGRVVSPVFGANAAEAGFAGQLHLDLAVRGEGGIGRLDVVNADEDTMESAAIKREGEVGAELSWKGSGHDAFDAVLSLVVDELPSAFLEVSCQRGSGRCIGEIGADDGAGWIGCCRGLLLGCGAGDGGGGEEESASVHKVHGIARMEIRCSALALPSCITHDAMRQ